MEQKKIFEQHTENTEFIEKLTFYKDEIQILQHRLEEIGAKNNQADCMKDLERFQNQLIVQRNNIDEIKHKVVVDEDRLINEIKKNEVASDHRSTEYHKNETEEMNSFEKNFADLRKDMNLFFAKWM